MTGIARHTPSLSGDISVRLVAVDSGLLPDIGDAITQLTNEYVWTEVGDPVSDIVASVFETVTKYYDTMLIGLVSQFIASIPPGWLQLDGATYSENDYPLLYARLPDQLKNGANFTLPDLTDVFPIGATDSSEIGDEGGSNSFQLSIAQLPSHNHLYVPVVLDIDIKTVGAPDPFGGRLGAPTATTNTGSGNSIDNRPAFVEMLFAVYAGQE